MGMISNLVTKKLFGKLAGNAPKVIDAKTHGIIDYAQATLFLSAGWFFWKSDRKAAAVTLSAGAFLLTEALLTDYPLGAHPVISFPVHGRLDRGFVGFVATAPKTFEFKSEAATRFFRANSALEGLVVSLTNFEPPQAVPVAPASTAAPAASAA